jgi:hypothetical protein
MVCMQIECMFRIYCTLHKFNLLVELELNSILLTVHVGALIHRKVLISEPCQLGERAVIFHD